MPSTRGKAAPDALISAADSKKYWQGINADVDGMLGGFSSVSRVDLQGSRAFLARLGIGTKAADRHKVARVLEGGAGIGRITTGLLTQVAERVDVIEPVAKFTAELKSKPGVGDVFTMGLEEWQPTEGVQYSLIWVQWCAGYLNDEKLVQFLGRCKSVLEPEGGIIVVKENTTNGDKDIFDQDDSSVTRTQEKYEDIFKRAGLRILKKDIQRLPGELNDILFPVWMYGLTFST